MAGTLDQSQTVGTSETAILYNGSNYEYVGQGITAGLAGPVVQVDLELRKTSGSPTGNAYLEIWSRAGNGTPLAKVSDSTAIDVSTISSTATWYSFAVTGSPTYNISDTYCIVFYYGGGDASNRFAARHKDSSVYAGGIMSRDTDGASWTDIATFDLNFKVYVQGAAAGYKNMLLMGVG